MIDQPYAAARTGLPSGRTNKDAAPRTLHAAPPPHPPAMISGVARRDGGSLDTRSSVMRSTPFALVSTEANWFMARSRVNRILVGFRRGCAGGRCRETAIPSQGPTLIQSLPRVPSAAEATPGHEVRFTAASASSSFLVVPAFLICLRRQRAGGGWPSSSRLRSAEEGICSVLMSRNICSAGLTR